MHTYAFRHSDNLRKPLYQNYLINILKSIKILFIFSNNLKNNIELN